LPQKQRKIQKKVLTWTKQKEQKQYPYRSKFLSIGNHLIQNTPNNRRYKRVVLEKGQDLLTASDNIIKKMD
jgi:hypothetical protein